MQNANPDLRQGIAIDSLPEGGMVQGRFDGDDVVLIRSRGTYFALQANCTHMGAPLCEGAVVEDRVHCPWHHARFSLATGEAIAAPAFSALERYATRVEGDRVLVAARLPKAAVHPAAVAESPRIVIVGAGAAGYACAELLARRGAGVTLIGNDPDGSYDRTMCSKQFLIGMAKRQETQLPELPGEVTRITVSIDRIEVQDRRVVANNGSATSFDKLVLATGARPHRPPLPGFDAGNVYTLRTLGDADAIMQASQNARHVVVVGASFIALEAAASLRQRHLDVTVIAADEIPLETLVGAEVGAMIKQVHEENGVRFLLKHEVRGFDGKRVLLDHGASLDADLVVLGLGVAPDTRLAQAAGIACASPDEGGGVLVDDFLQTSIPDIFAIGDIASYPHTRSAKRIRVEHWVHAQRQGQYLARMFLGNPAGYVDEPFFWSAHFDTGLRYVGHLNGIERTELDGSISQRSFTLRLGGGDQQAAFVSCNRDLPPLLIEAYWESANAGGHPTVKV